MLLFVFHLSNLSIRHSDDNILGITGKKELQQLNLLQVRLCALVIIAFLMGIPMEKYNANIQISR